MSTFSHVTHHFTRVPETQTMKVTRVTPIVRLTQLGETVYLQNGLCYAAGGQEMPLPEWAPAAMARLTPACLKEAGFEPSLADASLDTPTEAPQLWQCPECHKVMDPGAQAAHIAKHNAHRNADNQLDTSGKTLHLKH